MEATPLKQEFSDLDFAHLLSRSPKGGLVYIWSPHMALSINEIENIDQLDLKAPFTVILDPKANIELSKKIIKDKNCLKIIC